MTKSTPRHGHSGENAENFSLRDLLEQRGMALDERLANFAPVACGLQDRGVTMREVTGKPQERVRVRDPRGHGTSELLMLGSNNYLGLASEPIVIERAIDALNDLGVGCGGPPLLNGMTSLHRRLEARLAEHKACEDAMVFSSGYAANVGWVSGLLAPGDTLIYDEQSHASLVDGIKLGRVRSMPFSHNDPAAAQHALAKVRKERLAANIVLTTEGVFSMDGDIAPLAEMVALCKDYGALLAVDDAHGTGVLGRGGRGTPEHCGVHGEVDIVMGTFSKVFATTGGFVAGSRRLIDYLRYFARSYMFSASLAVPVVASVLAGLDFMDTHPERVDQLNANVRSFVEGLRAAGFDVACETAIVPLFLPAKVALEDVVRRLHEEGLFVNGIAYPAVPPDRQRLRLSMMATFTRDDVDFAVAKLAKVGRELGFLDHPRPVPAAGRAGV